MKVKVLLIDDDAEDREFFSEAIQMNDINTICYCAPDGLYAFEQLENGSIDLPHLIFLDVNMPLMSGWQCLEALKKHNVYKDIPVIMYSTSSYHEDIEKALNAGAFCFFTKPNDFRELRKSLLIIIENLMHKSLSSIQRSGIYF